MKNVIESIWLSFDTIIQAVNVWKGGICHFSEGGGGGAKVEDSGVIVLFFICEEIICFAIYILLDFLIILFSQTLFFLS